MQIPPKEISAPRVQYSQDQSIQRSIQTAILMADLYHTNREYVYVNSISQDLITAFPIHEALNQRQEIWETRNKTKIQM